MSTASLKSVCLNTPQVLLLHTKIWELFLGIVLGVLQSILQLGSFWSIAPDIVSWYHPRLEERRRANLCLFNLEELRPLGRLVLISPWPEVGPLATWKPFVAIGMGLPWTNHYFFLGWLLRSWFSKPWKLSESSLNEERRYDGGWHISEKILQKSCTIVTTMSLICQHRVAVLGGVKSGGQSRDWNLAYVLDSQPPLSSMELSPLQPLLACGKRIEFRMSQMP